MFGSVDILSSTQIAFWANGVMLSVSSAGIRISHGRNRSGRFARVALDVAQATVPRYRTAFSKHQFTQPQLLAILCLMRYEDWTYREAEVRLAEHCELRRALHLSSVPAYTTLYRFLRRLDEAAITR